MRQLESGSTIGPPAARGRASTKGAKVDDLGGRFWLRLIGLTIAIGIAALIVFLLIDVVWYAWGVVGALLVLFLVMLVIGWAYDRRQESRYDDVAT
jgi:membrane protein YdbS with pleckstrin-like domain